MYGSIALHYTEMTGQLHVSVASLNKYSAGPQRLSGPFGEWRSVLFLPGIEQRFLGCPAYNSVVTVPFLLCLLRRASLCAIWLFSF